MGIAGAGLSTTISQYISAIVLFLMFRNGRTQSTFNVRYFTTDMRVVKNILTVGFPSLVRQGLTSVSTMILNNCAGLYGDAAVAAMTSRRVGATLFQVGLATPCSTLLQILLCLWRFFTLRKKQTD